MQYGANEYCKQWVLWERYHLDSVDDFRYLVDKWKVVRRISKWKKTPRLRFKDMGVCVMHRDS